MVQTILILAANPKGTTPLRLDEEVREIDAGLQRAKHREQFVLEQKWAVRPRDIQRAMLDINPSIVHFSGHGAEDEGLVFEDETGQAKLVDGEALAGLFELFADQVECVVLNGCYSEVQAEAITQHVTYVIGMKKAIGDRSAIEFAVSFYDALASGRPVEFAYKFGCAAIRLAGIPEQLTPTLKKKPNQPPQLAEDRALTQTAALVKSKDKGDIGKYEKGVVRVEYTNVNLHDFIVEAQFHNPYDGAMDNWTYGFAFHAKNPSNNLNAPQGRSFDVWISSKEKKWNFISVRSDDLINRDLEGKLPNFNVSDNGSNKLRLTVNKNKATFFINDMYIETFDVSEFINKGNVLLIAKDGISGKSIQYQNLKIWSLDN
ncbi:hypothetical protein NIES4073_62720 [Kalymmatonema gypsitolerans NIES-4073]|nr:hypothetical protein NIES4073_62720 [Scytonema sp. NIES-4073]